MRWRLYLFLLKIRLHLVCIQTFEFWLWVFSYFVTILDKLNLIFSIINSSTSSRFKTLSLHLSIHISFSPSWIDLSFGFISQALSFKKLPLCLLNRFYLWFLFFLFVFTILRLLFVDHTWFYILLFIFLYHGQRLFDILTNFRIISFLVKFLRQYQLLFKLLLFITVFVYILL